MVIALSLANAGGVAFSICEKDITWIQKLFSDIAHEKIWSGRLCYEFTNLLIGSSAVLLLTTNTQIFGRNKHVDLKMHHVKGLSATKGIKIDHIPSSLQITDLMTTCASLQKVRKIIGLKNLKSF